MITNVRQKDPLRLVSIIVALLATTFFWAAPMAQAATTMTVTDTAGTADPVEDIARKFTFTGTTSGERYLWVKYRSAGGAPCATNVGLDSGTYFFSTLTETINGNFSKSKDSAWESSGTFMFCIWEADSSTSGYADDDTPTSIEVTFRDPTASITGSLTGGANNVSIGANTWIEITGTSEAPRKVYASTLKGRTTSCATTYGADSGTGLFRDESVNGNFTLKSSEFTPTTDDKGTYTVCLWVAESTSDTTPVATGVFTYTVGATSGGGSDDSFCSVPNLRGKTLAKAKKLLTANGCSVGTVTRKKCRGGSCPKRGRVWKQSRKAGLKLDAGTKINFVIRK